MLIPTDELADLIRRCGLGAAPRETAATGQAISWIVQGRRSADLNSKASRHLNEAVAFATPYLGMKAVEELDRIDIYGVDCPYINAIPFHRDGRLGTIIFNGMLQLIRYTTYMIKVIDGLQVVRPDKRFDLDGESIPEHLAYSMAAHSLLADSIEKSVYPLDITNMLSPRMLHDGNHAYQLSIAFILLHELGHLNLGHHLGNGVHSERKHFSLLEQQQLTDLQRMELEADAYAMELIAAGTRELVPGERTVFVRR